jgi:tartrate-resistant acid phosphatase type 5
MAAIFQSKWLRYSAIAVFLLLFIGFLLKDKATELWQHEVSEYRGLQDGGYIPTLQAQNLADKDELGVLVFGDGGTGKPGQYEVGAGMWNLCQQKSCDLALGLGDNIYPSGVTSVDDPQWLPKFESPYKRFVDQGSPDFWMAVGNHDRRGSVDAQIRYTERSPIWKMPARDYPVPGLPDWLGIYVLDSVFIAVGGDIPNFQWAYEKNFHEQLLRASAHLCGKPGWRILATHHPLVSNGARNNRFRENNMHDALNEFIAECGIHMVVSGHEHMQQHVRMDGVDYLIQGAASSVRGGTKPLQHESAVSLFRAVAKGFSHLTFSSDRVKVQFNDSKGEELYHKIIPLEDGGLRRKQAAESFL